MVLECRALLGLYVPLALTSVPRITHCMCVAGASLCSYSAPRLRWFLASIREARVVWVCEVRGDGNLTTLNVKSKGYASCACGAVWLRGPGSMVVWLRIFLIWADPRAAVRAWFMPGDPMKMQKLALDQKYSHM